MAGGSKKVVIAALAGNSAVALAKLAAAAVTGSSAVFAEAVHSVVAAGSQALLLLGIRRAARPADVAHPLGYGREIYFWAFVGAVLLFSLGAGITFFGGIQKFMNPSPIENAGWAYVVLLSAMVVQAGAFGFAWMEFTGAESEKPLPSTLRKMREPTGFSVISGGTASLAGLVVALLGVFCSDQLGWLRADGFAAIVIAAFMALTAIYFSREINVLLIGESATDNFVEDIVGLAGQANFVEAVNEVRTIHFGPMEVLVNVSVDARDHFTAGEVETGVAELETTIKEAFPEVNRVFVELRRADESQTLPLPERDPHADPGPAVA